MQRLFIVVSLCTLVASCSYSVYENGRFITHKLPKPTSDSIFTVSLMSKAQIPHAAVEISETEIKAPLQKVNEYERMVTYAKYEAGKLGGNVIKVTNYHGLFGTPYLKQAIFATVYKLDKQSLDILKAQTDSIAKAYADSIKDISIVHLKNYDGTGGWAISFNDTLVAEIKKAGRKPIQKDLVFNAGGTLSMGNKKLAIKKGNEYYIILYTTFRMHQIVYHYELVDKEHFYNKLS